jgi:hypothetical protein
MSFMWHSKAKAAEEEDVSGGEEILSSCNTSVVNISNSEIDSTAAAGSIQYIGDVDEVGRGGGATVSKSIDYVNRVTSETLFPPPPPLPTIDASYSSLPGDALQSPPSPMSSSVASNNSHAVDQVGSNKGAPPSPVSSSSSNLSMKPEGLSDSLLDEVAAAAAAGDPPSRLLSPSEPRSLLVESVIDEGGNDDASKKNKAKLRPSDGLCMEPRDASVAVTSSQMLDLQQSLVGKTAANAEQQHSPPPPTNVDEASTTPQDDKAAVTNEASILGNAAQQPVPPPLPPPPPANDGQESILSWFVGKWNFLPNKLDLFFDRCSTTTTATTTSSLAAGLVCALKYMIVVAFMFGLLLKMETFFRYTSKMPMMMNTVPSPVVAIASSKEGIGSSVPLPSFSLSNIVMVNNKQRMKEPVLKQPMNATFAEQATTLSVESPPPLPPACNKKAALVSTAISTMRAMITPREVGRVSEETHEEVINLDDGQFKSPTRGPQQQQQHRATTVPPPTKRQWSIILGLSFLSATVYLSMVALLSASILWLVLMGGDAKKDARAKKLVPPTLGTATDWNLATIGAALEEPLSGKGRQSKTISMKNLGWDPTNYEQLTMDEIHRLLHLLHAPSYNRNVSKSVLLGFLYERYGALLHKCNTQQLKAVLQYKGVRYSCGTKKKELVVLALHAGFTITTQY